MARRDDRTYREYVREEQRRQPGCPARKLVVDQRIQATRPHGEPLETSQTRPAVTSIAARIAATTHPTPRCGSFIASVGGSAVPLRTSRMAATERSSAASVAADP